MIFVLQLKTGKHISVPTMYVDTCKSGKYVRHLPRESCREGGKVKHRTVTNISQCSGQEIKAVKWALKHKRHLDEIIESSGDPPPEPGGFRCARRCLGAVWLLAETVRGPGIAQGLRATPGSAGFQSADLGRRGGGERDSSARTKARRAKRVSTRAPIVGFPPAR